MQRCFHKEQWTSDKLSKQGGGFLFRLTHAGCFSSLCFHVLSVSQSPLSNYCMRAFVLRGPFWAGLTCVTMSFERVERRFSFGGPVGGGGAKGAGGQRLAQVVWAHLLGVVGSCLTPVCTRETINYLQIFRDDISGTQCIVGFFLQC